MKRSKGYVFAAFLSIVLAGFLLVWASKWRPFRESSVYVATVGAAGNPKSFIWSLTKLGTEQEINFVDFIDSRVGWAGTRTGLLYRTMDGGKSWSMTSDLGGAINSLYFSSHLVGWVIQQKYSQDFDKTSFEAQILYTNDAGKNWKVQFVDKSVELLRLTFAGNKGWIVGSRFSRSNGVINSEFILLRTTDDGKTWLPSPELNNFVVKNFSKGSESPADITAIAPETLNVLTGNGVLLTTTNGGVTWRRSGFPFLDGLSAQRLLLAADGSSKILAGIGRNHGVASILAVRNGDESWTSNTLTRFFLRDAHYISSREVIAVGSMVPEDADPWTQDKEGVVIYSANDGRNWTLIYQSRNPASINALDSADGQHVWAVGSTGTIIQLTNPNRQFN